MSECEPKLLVCEVINVVHHQWVLVRLVHGHVDNSNLPVSLNHFLDVVDALDVNMHTLNLLAHHFAYGVKSCLRWNLLDATSYSLELLLDQILVIDMSFLSRRFSLFEEIVKSRFVQNFRFINLRCLIFERRSIVKGKFHVIKLKLILDNNLF
jgi:hypothetical protein